MNTEFNLLKNLIAAIRAVHDTSATAANAFKEAYAASVLEKVSANAALMHAGSRSTHANHEYAAVLGDAIAHVTSRALT